MIPVRRARCDEKDDVRYYAGMRQRQRCVGLILPIHVLVMGLCRPRYPGGGLRDRPMWRTAGSASERRGKRGQRLQEFLGKLLNSG